MITSSLYIHIPFCARKCLFCSFVIAVGQEHRREEYVNALICEMRKYQGVNISSIYFGGGTPSILDAEHFEKIFFAIRNNFVIQNDIEICIEANPESINHQKAKVLKSFGFNRISLGAQSLNDRYLKFLGRAHDAGMARDAYQILREAGFSNINLDLMYAFPGETAEELEADVRAIAALSSEHLSLYTLTIEPNSRFYANQMKLDDDEILATHYLMIARILKEYGFEQYEVSNFAKPGFGSKHNKNYWLGTPYIGLGVGAHGFSGERRYWNTSKLQEYIQKSIDGKDLVDGFEELSAEQQVVERVLFGLRMNEGIPWDILPTAKRQLVHMWIKDGFLSLEQDRLKVTDQGRLVLDELSSRLI